MLAIVRKIKTFRHVSNFCNHCTKNHAWVCNCGHSHDQHLLYGPCLHCKDCETYNQSGQRMLGEPQDQFEYRVLRRRN